MALPTLVLFLMGPVQIDDQIAKPKAPSNQAQDETGIAWDGGRRLALNRTMNCFLGDRYDLCKGKQKELFLPYYPCLSHGCIFQLREV